MKMTLRPSTVLPADKLPDGPAAADLGDEEGCTDSPSQPVAPVEQCPVLGEVGLTHGIELSGDADKIVQEVPDGCNSGFHKKHGPSG